MSLPGKHPTYPHRPWWSWHIISSVFHRNWACLKWPVAHILDSAVSLSFSQSKKTPTGWNRSSHRYQMGGKGCISNRAVLDFISLWDFPGSSETIILAENEESNGVDVSWPTGRVSLKQRKQFRLFGENRICCCLFYKMYDVSGFTW